ncbi:hypothetical protein IYN87_01400 [Campylobacter curvus]|nr:hypothetical protein [Campylobacter curvus]
MSEYEYSSGIDSIRFVLSKSTALSFLKKHALQTRLRLVSRNKTIKEYVEYKFKGANKPLLNADKRHPYKVRYVSFKRGVKSLSNTMIVIENSNELNDLCKKRKKALGYYVMIVFAGLFQPSRELYKETYRILGKFLRRFKPFSLDLAHDFESDEKVDYKFKEAFKDAVKEQADGVIVYKSSIYANSCKSDKYYGLNKILLYDKFEKQTNYHRQKIDEKFKNWKRLELTFKLNKKFLNFIENKSYMECVEVLDEIVYKLTSDFPFGVAIDRFKEQIAFFKDMRRRVNLKRTIF